MKVHSIRLLIIALLFVIIGAVTVINPESADVFRVGSRNIPIYSVENNNDMLALTFNCAWGNEDIDDILTLLDKYKAKATFFIVGEWAEKYPDDVKKIYSRGHEIGEHSYSHKDYTTMQKKEISEDIYKTSSAINEIIGITPSLIRVPSGAYNDNAVSAIESLGYIPIQWSKDSIDYSSVTCDEIFDRVTKNIKSGDIILMHAGTANTVKTLPRILDSLTSKFTLVTVSDLLLQDNYTVNAEGKMISK